MIKGILLFSFVFVVFYISQAESQLIYEKSVNEDLILKYCTKIFMSQYNLNFEQAQKDCSFYYNKIMNTSNGNSISQTSNGFIELIHNDWKKDNLNIIIIWYDSDKYVEQVKNAINIWSSALKDRSKNYNIWNFDISDKGNISPRMIFDDIKYSNTDVVIELKRNPLIDCSNLGETLIKKVGKIVQKPIYSTINISCQLENKETFVGKRLLQTNVLHEFGHILGLGHAYNIENDLMCSPENPLQNDFVQQSCNISPIIEKPSNSDIDAILYLYGYDGFQLPNQDLKKNMVFAAE